MAYAPTVYVNDNPPAINADNLNHMEQGIYDNDTAIFNLSSSVEHVSRKTRNLIKLKDASGTVNLYTYNVKNNHVKISISGASGQKDLQLQLQEKLTLPAGTYTISFQGTYSVSTTFYIFLHSASGYGSNYGISSSTGKVTITLAEERVVDFIMFRSSNPSSINIDADFQLESGSNSTTFISPFSAYDAGLEEIVTTKDTVLNSKIEEIKKDISNKSRETRNLVKLENIQKEENGYSYIAKNNHISISAQSLSGSKDLNIPLHEQVTLVAGKYYISLNGTLSLSSSVTVYLMNTSGTAKAYGTVPVSAGFIGITVSEGFILNSIRFRTSNAGNVSISADFQLEKDDRTPFISSYSARDAILEEKINRMDYQKFEPIFDNCTISNGVIDYESNSYTQWIVTPEIYHIVKGSSINPKAGGFIFYLVEYNANGEFVSSTQYTNYVFTEDKYVRFAMRESSYASITPAYAKTVMEFDVFTDEKIESVTKCTFIGLSKTATSGQGFLAKLPDGKNLLIDSHYMSYYNAFTNFLRSRGVRRIDYYVQSHYHSDHISLLNSLKYLSGKIDISNAVVFLPPLLTEESIDTVSEDHQTLIDRQNEFIEILEENNCTIIRPNNGDIYKITDEISLLFYNCDHSIYNSTGDHTSTNYNDWSLCCYVMNGLNAINISADIGPIGQNAVGGSLPKATILTAPHHGWDNGVNNLIPKFINNVNPDVVISTNGTQHMPDNEESPANIMLKTSPMQSYCEANGVPNYPTFLNGPIEILMYKYGWKFNGNYSKYIRNNKNWKFNDNTDKIET